MKTFKNKQPVLVMQRNEASVTRWVWHIRFFSASWGWAALLFVWYMFAGVIYSNTKSRPEFIFRISPDQ